MKEEKKLIKGKELREEKPEENKTAQSTEGGEVKKKISEKNLAIIITAAILLAVIIAGVIVFVVQSIKKDAGFDYMKSSLADYVEFTKDYKDFEINVDIAKPKDIDVDVAILSLLCADKSESPNYGGGLVKSNHTIGIGDVVHIWYRGYLIGEDGEEINVAGMSNFGNETPHELEIGSGGFIPGFELNLIGKQTHDSNPFVKITEGTPKEGQIAYISFTRTTGSDKKDKITETNVRVDLSENIDDQFGNGFKARLMLGNIGSKIDFQVETDDGKMYNYTDAVVNFVTECEDKVVSIETYFPYSYGTQNLRNEKAIFEVYFDGVVDYDGPEKGVENATAIEGEIGKANTIDSVDEITDEYLKKQFEDEDIKISLDEVNEFEGETLVERYFAFAKDALDKLYEEEYRSMVESAIWDYYKANSKANKYPEKKIEEIYKEYINDIERQFDISGGQVYNQYTGSYQTYQTIDTYAPAYLGLTSGTNWKAYVTGIAQSLVKERMVMYYIMRTENLVPTDAEVAAEVEKVRQEYLDEYVKQYLEYENKTEDDFTDAEYKEFVEARRGEIFSYYDDEHFVETAHYNLFVEKILDWPDVVTLDERRAYPVKK